MVKGIPMCTRISLPANKRFRPHLTRVAPLLLSALLPCAGSTLLANGTWSGAGGDSLWSNSANWVSGTIPTASGDATFLQSGTVTIDSGRSVGRIYLDKASEGSVLVVGSEGPNGGNSLQISGNELGNRLDSFGSIVINAPIQFTGTTGGVSFFNNVDILSNLKTFVVNGDVTTTGTGAFNLNLWGAGRGDSVIRGSISNGAAATFSLSKADSGRWQLTGNNTYNGSTTVLNDSISIQRNTSELVIAGTAGALANTSSLSVGRNSSLELKNTASANLSNRLVDSASVTLDGGSLVFSNDGSASNFSESVGDLTYNGGARIETSRAGAGGTSTLSIASLTLGADATLEFRGEGLGTAENKVLITSGPTLANGLIRSVTVGGDFATYDSTNGVSAYTGHVTSGDSTWTADSNVKTSSGPVSLSGERTISTLTLGGNALDLNGNTLNVENGIAVSNSANAVINATGGGNLTSGTLNVGGKLFINTPNNLEVRAGIADNGSGAVDLFVGGNGRVTLTANNSYSGGTVVGSGTLQLGDGGSTGNAGSGAISVASYGTLAVNRNDGLTLNNLSGGGLLRQVGSGTTSVGGTGSFSGSIEVNNGRLNFGNGLTIGSGASLLFVRNGAALSIGDNSSLTTINGMALDGTLYLGANTTFTSAVNSFARGNQLEDYGGMTGFVIGSGSTSVFNASNSPFWGTQAGSGGNEFTLTDVNIINATNFGPSRLSENNTLTLANGVEVTTGAVSIGSGGGNNNTLNVNGSSRVTSSGQVAITGNNTLSINGGKFIGTVLNMTSGTASTVNVTNGGLLQTTGGGSFLTQVGSKVTVSGSGSTWNLGNRFLTIGTNVTSGSAGQGNSLEINQGGLVRTAGISLRSVNNWVSFDGGTLESGTSANLIFGSGTVRIGSGGVTINTAGFNSTISSAMVDSGATAGAFNKVGNGTLTLSGTSSYSGDVTVSGGTLVVNGILPGAVRANAASVLGGSGSVGALTVASGASITPGNGLGTLTVSSASFETGSLMELQLSDVNWDKLLISGNLDLTGLDQGGITLRLSAFTAFDENKNYSWSNVISYGSLTGGIDTDLFVIDSSAMPANGTFSLSNDVANRTISINYEAVPEPNAALFVFFSSIAMLLNRRKRRG